MKDTTYPENDVDTRQIVSIRVIDFLAGDENKQYRHLCRVSEVIPLRK